MSERISLQERLAAAEATISQRPEILGFQAYEYMRSPDTDVHRRQLDCGIETQPQYGDLDEQSLIDLELAMRSLILNFYSSKDPLEVRSIFDAVVYRHGEVCMLARAADMNNMNLQDQNREESVRWFRAANEGLYGKPSSEVFSAIMTKNFVPVFEDSPRLPIEAAKIRDEIRSKLGEILPSEYQLYSPNQDTIDRIGALVKERYKYLFDNIDPDSTYGTEEMAAVMKTALEKIGAAELGWTEKIAPNSKALAVSAHQKLVEIGAERPAIKGVVLQGRVIHEVGVHVMRSVMAEEAGWLTATYGHADYLDFEEGLATALEDALHGKYANHGENYYAIAGLAYGLDNHSARTMGEVYEIMWRHSALKKYLVKPEVSERDIEKSKVFAYNQCFRLFRSTTTTDPGVVYLKDLAYFKGQQAAWSVLRKVHTQDQFELLFCGKLNLQDDEQAHIAAKIYESNRGKH